MPGVSGLLAWGNRTNRPYPLHLGPNGLLATYGPVDADTELRTRALAVRLSVPLADYAVRDHRLRLLTEALAGLRRVSR